MQKPKIGFIGLGLMGSAMVERLQSLGYELIVKGNRSRQKIEEAVSRGSCRVSLSKADGRTSRDCDVLCG